MESSFLLILIIISLYFPFQIASASNTLIQSSCNQAAKTDPELDHKFCVSRLESNPKSKNITSFEKLVVVSVKLAISDAGKISSDIKKLLNDRSKLGLSHFSISCLKSCLELYTDAVPTLKEALSVIKAKDYELANMGVSSAMDAPSICEDGFKGKRGYVSPLTKENGNFSQFTAISLAFINMCST